MHIVAPHTDTPSGDARTHTHGERARGYTSRQLSQPPFAAQCLRCSLIQRSNAEITPLYPRV